MRLHDDEKPFQCNWPGCGKGFDKVHDCKRHEQVHFNGYRPHRCEGCGKSFQRMDGLYRHRKSSVHFSQPILINPSQYARREGRTVKRLKTRPKPTARPILRKHLALRTLLVALWRWTSTAAATSMKASKMSPAIGSRAAILCNDTSQR